MAVTVTFQYEPEEPDPEDRSGVSEAEYERLMDELMQLGATDIQVNG